MSEKEYEKLNVVFIKQEISPGQFVIKGVRGDLLKKAGVTEPFPVSEKVAEIIINDLTDIVYYNYNLDAYDISRRNEIQNIPDQFEDMSLALRGIAMILNFKTGTGKTDTGNLEDMIKSDKFLLIEEKNDVFLFYSEAVDEAMKYFQKYNILVPLKNFYPDDDIFKEKRDELTKLFYSRFNKLSNIYRLIIKVLYHYFNEYSIIMPFLWTINVLPYYNLVRSYLDIHFGTVDYSGNTPDELVYKKEAFLNYKGIFLRKRVENLEKMLKQYINDETKMCVN